jgi:RNA polymerase sigma factor (TIGR02999 family)
MTMSNAATTRSATYNVDVKTEAQLLPLVYDQLCDRAMAVMSYESSAHILQPGALVHEAYIRLVNSKTPEWKNRTHFLAVFSAVMRRVLVDHGRHRTRKKRGGNEEPVSLSLVVDPSLQDDPDGRVLDDALQALSRVNARQAKVVVYRFYGGMSVAEVADEMQLSRRTIEAEWTKARAWLRRALQGGTKSCG